MIEVLVAFTVLAVAFVAIEGGAIGSVTASVTAGQRATATSLAGQAIAEAEALPFSDLQAGLNSSQLQAALGTTPAPAWNNEVNYSSGTTSSCTSQYTLNLPGVSSPLCILVANSATGGEPPLVPFSSAQRLGGISYDVAVFPATDPVNASLVTVTAIVSWSAPPDHVASTTIEQVEVGLQ